MIIIIILQTSFPDESIEWRNKNMLLVLFE